MRKLLYLVLIMLISVAWAAAQQDASAPGSAGQSQTQPGSTAPGTMPGQSQAPGAPGQSQAPGASASPDASSPAAGDNQIVEGCLGGTAPDFTVTDKAGTSYKLDVPKDAEPTLTKHKGESVKVAGAVSGSSSPKTIQVVQMGRGTGTCPASGSSSTGTSGSSTSGTSNPGTSSGASSSGAGNSGSSTTPRPK